MGWRFAVAVGLCFVGAMVPAAVLLYAFGPDATIGTASADSPRLVLLLLGSMLGTLACGLTAGVLARVNVL